jgi:hypothetical protein
VLAAAVPLALGCGAAAPAYYGPPADQSGAALQAEAAGWALPGLGYSEPAARVLAQADAVAQDEFRGTGPAGPAGGGQQPGPETVDGATDAADVTMPPEGEGEDLSWEEIALPEVERPAERLVIKNGTLRIELEPPEDGVPLVTEIARQFGGYVQSSSTTSITIRVPNSAFEQVMNAIAEIGEVAERTVSGEDVTEEYYDLNVRLRNALAVRQRYLALLEQARSVDEALLVERELERVTLEIEELRGRLRFLRDRVADSTITVYFVEEYEAPEEASPGPVGWIFYGLYLGIKWLFVWDEPGPGR